MKKSVKLIYFSQWVIKLNFLYLKIYYECEKRLDNFNSTSLYFSLERTLNFFNTESLLIVNIFPVFITDFSGNTPYSSDSSLISIE